MTLSTALYCARINIISIHTEIYDLILIYARKMSLIAYSREYIFHFSFSFSRN